MPAKLQKLQKIVFFVIIFFLSSQAGMHFWPEFSKVSGIRIDYLSPTLYLLDILIIAWIGLNVFSGQFNNVKIVRGKDILKSIFLLFALSLILGIFLSKSSGAHIFGVIKLTEFGLLGWFVAKTFEKKDISYFVRMLALSAVISSALGIWQFFMQSSIGGLWYFIGERTFNISTIGISTVNLDQQILRPYGAFPHPNILAFFLLTAIAFSLMRLPYEDKPKKILLLVSILLSSFTLILTFSRVIILAAICLFMYAIYTNGKPNTVRAALGRSPVRVLPWMGLLGLLGLVTIFFFPYVLKPEFILRGIDFRQELLTQSLQIFVNNPYFGIGLNNFFVHQVELVKNISPIIFQPPHNIFVLALLSLGIFGWWVFPIAIFLAVRSLILKLKTRNLELRDFYRSVLFMLISIIVVGMFDHFFLTLEQGQIILALILGLSFVNLTNNK